MVKKTKLPKFQNLPTLADLAKRRKQSVSSLLTEWDILDIPSLERRLVREGLSQEFDKNDVALFLNTAEVSVTETTLPAVKAAVVEPTVMVDQIKKIQKQTEIDSKKLTKIKLSLDAVKSGTENRVASEPVVVVSVEAEKPSNET